MTDSVNKANNYPFYTWVLTIIIAPFIWITNRIPTPEEWNLWSLLEVLPVFWILGLLFSLPTLVIFVLCYQILTRKKATDLILKSVLMIIGVSGSFFTFKFISGSISMELFWFYSLTMIFFIWVIKTNRIGIKTKNQRLKNQNQDLLDS